MSESLQLIAYSLQLPRHRNTLKHMSKPRNNPHRELYGIIGHVPDASKILKEWNARFRAQGMDASMDVYPTTEKNLPERLSEMFHFDRRGYIVGKDLAIAIVPFLDHVEPEAEKKGIDFVWNDGGVLRGQTSGDVNLSRLEFTPESSTLFS